METFPEERFCSSDKSQAYWTKRRARIVRDLEEADAYFDMLLVNGSTDSSGTAGARGRLTHVSEILDLLPTDASSTPVIGSNTYQGRLTDISWRSRGAGGEEFTATVSFDYRTASRLRERVYGDRGWDGTVDLESFPMTVILEPATT